MIRVTDAGLEAVLLEHPYIFVAFILWDSIPCRHAVPELTRFSEKRMLPTFLCDLDENPTVADHFRISFVPSAIVFRDGKEVLRMEGPYSVEAITDRVKKSFPTLH